MNKKGFTLIEILVVVAITAVLSGLAIVYTHAGQDQISLSIEESKIAQLILEAKDLSIATYAENTNTCAYGVNFDYANATYSLFAYNTAKAVNGGREVCPSIAVTAGAVDTAAINKYSNGSWQVHVAQGVALHNGPSAIQDILFYPPDPCTMVSIDGKTFLQSCVSPGTFSAQAYVYLNTVNGSAARTISVNSMGQVSL